MPPRTRRTAAAAAAAAMAADLQMQSDADMDEEQVDIEAEDEGQDDNEGDDEEEAEVEVYGEEDSQSVSSHAGSAIPRLIPSFRQKKTKMAHRQNLPHSRRSRSHWSFQRVMFLDRTIVLVLLLRKN